MDRLLKHKWSSPSVLSHHWQEFLELQADGEKEFWQPKPPNATTCTATSEAISVWWNMFASCRRVYCNLLALRELVEKQNSINRMRNESREWKFT
jgi:hypothetical protein